MPGTGKGASDACESAQKHGTGARTKVRPGASDRNAGCVLNRVGLGAPMLVLLAMFSGCGGPEPSASGETKTFTNPVYDKNFPDPFILWADGTYHAYSTNDSGANVPTLTSEDLVEWTRGADAMPDLAEWGNRGKTWAPEVLRREDGAYVLYYTATSAGSGKQCIGRAIADSPEGPFIDESEEPLVCQADEGGSIDASPFRDGDGSPYLLWKNDGNCCGLDTFIYSQKLSPDGLSLGGEPERLMKQDAAWEGQLVEAPLMWERDGEHYLFFSGNAFDSESYAVGYARCEGPSGPCEKASENPILKTSDGAAGPGHVAIVEDGEGKTWMAYHAWPRDAVGSKIPGRTFWIDELAWEDGHPTVKGPTGGAQPAPR